MRNVPRWLWAPGLDVGDLLAVADGLDVVRCEGGGGAEQGGHALAQAVAHWAGALCSFMIMIICIFCFIYAIQWLWIIVHNQENKFRIYSYSFHSNVDIFINILGFLGDKGNLRLTS